LYRSYYIYIYIHTHTHTRANSLTFGHPLIPSIIIYKQKIKANSQKKCLETIKKMLVHILEQKIKVFSSQ